MYELWGGANPDQPENALRAQISRLRKRLAKLEPDRPESRLRSYPDGYRLIADPNELDANRFVAAVRELRARADGSSPDWVATRVRQALSAWRGPVLGGVVGGRICQAASRLYEDERLRAYELLYDAELRRGNHVAIVAELGQHITSYSTSLDRFCELLMVALYRSGRQADALDVYRRTVELLGLTGAPPSARLRDCESAILSQDPALTSDWRRRAG